MCRFDTIRKVVPTLFLASLTAYSQATFVIPENIVTGPFNRPVAIDDGFGNLQPSLLVFSDSTVEEYVPGNITSLAWEQLQGLQWHSTGKYLVKLYEYNKRTQSTLSYDLAVDTRNRSFQIEHAWWSSDSKTFSFDNAPSRLAKTVNAISNIVARQFKLYNNEIVEAKKRYGIKPDVSVSTPKTETHAIAPVTGGPPPIVRDGVYLAGKNGVSDPLLIYSVAPEFSDEARKERYQGVVLVGLVVGADGLPKNPHILHGLGMGLDEKAIEAVSQYRFKPAMLNGQPVPVTFAVQVTFLIY